MDLHALRFVYAAAEAVAAADGRDDRLLQVPALHMFDVAALEALYPAAAEDVSQDEADREQRALAIAELKLDTECWYHHRIIPPLLEETGSAVRPHCARADAHVVAARVNVVLSVALAAPAAPAAATS